MNERQMEPPVADVRPFLPQPGEPAEAYAARLRALHRDLTLVLDAVERGLAASPPPPPVAEAPPLAPAPAPDHAPEVDEPIAIAVEPVLPLDAPARREPPFSGLPRVEVVPRSREGDDDESWAEPQSRRASDEPPAPPLREAPRPATPFHTAAPGAPVGREAPPVGATAIPATVAPPGGTRPPVGEEVPRPGVTAHQPIGVPRPQRNGPPPVALAAAVAGWLAALALLIAVLVGG